MIVYWFICRLEENQKKVKLGKGPSIPFKPAEDPFLSFKIPQNTLFSSLEENQKKVKPSENKSVENSLLSVKKTEGGLFSADLSKNNLFANSGLFKTGSEANEKNLFSTNNLFANSGLKAKTKTFKKSFGLSDDFLKMGKFYLNPLESDVTFKGEDQGFPAHKAILSERCKFFKAMFASKVFLLLKILRNV